MQKLIAVIQDITLTFFNIPFIFSKKIPNATENINGTLIHI